jgi:toxin ParE1/3/4
MIQVQFDPRARREANRAEDYFLANGFVSADNFVKSFKAAMARIIANPSGAMPFRKRYRCVKLSRYRYVIYYHHVDADNLIVYAVAHTSRRPGYWLYRTRR